MSRHAPDRASTPPVARAACTEAAWARNGRARALPAVETDDPTSFSLPLPAVSLSTAAAQPSGLGTLEFARTAGQEQTRPSTSALATSSRH